MWYILTPSKNNNSKYSKHIDNVQLQQNAALPSMFIAAFPQNKSSQPSPIMHEAESIIILAPLD